MKLKPPPGCQPPPLRRHSGGSPMDDGLTDSTAKINEEEKEVNSVIDVPINPVKVKHSRSRPYYSRRCKRLNLLNTNINSLPDEIVSEILLRIPAQDIYCAVRPVCLKWYQMIRTHEFVNTHLQRSTYGLLIQNYEPLKTQLTFMELSRQGRIELTRLNYEPGYEIWCSSCNGLILESDGNHSALSITNPVTMQHFSLPPSPLPYLGMGYFFSALAYASLSMEYKVVRVYCYGGQWCCAIFTARADESCWSVRTQHLSLVAKDIRRLKPLTTEGFVHWPIRGNYILTLNVETEIITEYPIPSVCYNDKFGYRYYLSTVKYLSMLIAYQSCWGWLWDVWEMEPETGDWTKLPRIELEDRKCEILGWIFRSVGYSASWWLVPVGWLEYKEVLVYRVQGRTLEKPNTCIAWNIRLKKLEFIELDSNQNAFFVHRNSLVWLDGC